MSDTTNTPAPTPIQSLAPTSLTGDKLHPDDQKHVLAANQSRYTRTRCPEWAKQPDQEGKKRPLSFEDDDDWLKNSIFTGIDENGRIKHGRWSVKSTPSYPDNPELRPGYDPEAAKVKEEAPEAAVAAPQPEAPQKAAGPQPFVW